MKKNVVFLFDFSHLHKEVKKLTDWNKILIHEKGLVCQRELYEEVYLVNDLNDFEEVRSVLEQAMGNKRTIEKIVTSYEPCVHTAGMLRSYFHVEGLSQETTNLVRDKFEMKMAVKQLEISTAEVEKISAITDIEKFAEENGYPLIVKPINGAGTAHTIRLNHEEDLQSVATLLKNNPQQEFIVETFSKGEEYHVDSVVCGDDVCFTSIGKYLSNCIDTLAGNSLGSVIFSETAVSTDLVLRKIKEINEQVILGLGIKDSVCHSEYFVDSMGNVTFGEIGARIGGGTLISSTLLESKGINLYAELINVELYGKSTIPRLDDHYGGWLTLDSKKGTIKNISKEEELYISEHVKKVVLMKKVGDEIVDKTNTMIRTGFVINIGISEQEVKEELLQVGKNFILEVQ